MPNDTEKLKTLLLSERLSSAQKDSEIKKLQEKYQFLLEQFRLAQQKQFGKSSEAHPGQGELFNEAEAIQEAIKAPEKKRLLTPAINPNESLFQKIYPEKFG
ncbi:MAG: transposase [Enterobacterales bacterium]|nr:transposase [Enterobacterales bacterium]